MSRMNKLPDGWKRKRLERVSIIQTGIAKNQNSQQETIELPYLRVANVQDGYLDLAEIKTIKVHKDKVIRYSLEDGDVLLTEGGDFDKLGRGAVWNGQIKNCVHQNHVFAVRPKKNELLSIFLSAQTGSTYGKRYFLSCSKQSTNLASINSSQLKAFPVLLPPIPEQKAISNLLSTWDEAIEKTERLIQAKEKRFRGILGTLISDKLTMKNEKCNWEKVSLGDVFNSRKEKGRKGLPTLSVTLNNGIVDRAEIDRKMDTNLSPEKHLLIKSGDLAYNMMRMWQGASGAAKTDGIVSPAYIVLKPTEKIDSDFAAYWFKASRMIYLFWAYSYGLTEDRLRLYYNDFSKIKCFLPPLKEQRKIADTLNSARQEIDLLKQLAEKYKTQKRGLMQKMLTGEWRVKPEIVNQYMEA